MIKDLILSIIQGITEFLPISSSGHLLIFNRLLGTPADLFFIIILHLGTALSLIVFFLKDIMRALKSWPMIFKVLIVTFFTGSIYMLYKSFFESFFNISKYGFIPLFLFVNGIILILANRKMRKQGKGGVSYSDAVFLGIFQSFALLPGISRSGITISTLLFRGVDRQEAFKFSFIAAIPVIIGSFLFKIAENRICLISLLQFKYVAGFVVSFLVGYLSLYLLSVVIRRANLNIFGYYCFIIAAGIILLSLY